MRILFIVALCISFMFSCGGTCVKCHPKLFKNGSYDKDHIILQTCDSCHKNHDGNKSSPCGNDCWDCHVIKEVSESNVIEHKSLRYCMTCHIKLNVAPSNQMNIKVLF